MANDFSGDTNCIALWRMENGALTTDSKGTNTLTNYGVTNSTAVYKEGSASSYNDALDERLNIVDANLDSGFPFKSGESNTEMSICFWFRVTGFPASADRYIMDKGGDPTRAFYLATKKATSWSLRFGITSDGTTWEQEIDHGYALVINTWYHVGVTFKNSDKSYRIRVWDDTAGSLLGEVTGTATYAIATLAGLFEIGHNGSALGGYKDEVVVFNDILTANEIDAIRAGTYSAAAGWSGKINGIASANIAKINGIAIADIAKINGV